MAARPDVVIDVCKFQILGKLKQHTYDHSKHLVAIGSSLLFSDFGVGLFGDILRSLGSRSRRSSQLSIDV